MATRVAAARVAVHELWRQPDGDRRRPRVAQPGKSTPALSGPASDVAALGASDRCGRGGPSVSGREAAFSLGNNSSDSATACCVGVDA